jgi:2-dehydropantoate 2-reductase
MKPEILLIGTGAIGSFYAGKLWQAGARVTTLCRSDYEHVRNKGIRIKSVDGDFHFYPHSVIRNISDYGGKPDFIIVATKVLPGIDISSLIGKNIDPSASIVLIQNGIDVEKPVASAFPENEIISALAFICVKGLSQARRRGDRPLSLGTIRKSAHFTRFIRQGRTEMRGGR